MVEIENIYYGDNNLEEISFNNRENICYSKKNIGDKKIWDSRSVAVCIMVQFDQGFLVLKRGSHLMHGGKWSMPCGYLDRDEDIYEAASRELYEETGLFIDSDRFREIGFYEVVSNPDKDELQNVTFHFHIGVPKNIVKTDGKESISHSWVTKTNIEDYEIVFNHDERILNKL